MKAAKSRPAILLGAARRLGRARICATSSFIKLATDCRHWPARQTSRPMRANSINKLPWRTSPSAPPEARRPAGPARQPVSGRQLMKVISRNEWPRHRAPSFARPWRLAGAAHALSRACAASAYLWWWPSVWSVARRRLAITMTRAGGSQTDASGQWENGAKASRPAVRIPKRLANGRTE